jgi:hypothetical protein
MRRILTACICVAILAFPGCKGCKEQRARYGSMLRTKPASPVRTASASKQNFRGLDLTTASHTTRTSELPEVWEERPKGSQSYVIRKDVICYTGLDQTADGLYAYTVFYVPSKSEFYLQLDHVHSSTRTYYGPFDGDPIGVLKLETKSTTEQRDELDKK